jgi:hypothetical protein
LERFEGVTGRLTLVLSPELLMVKAGPHDHPSENI